MKADVAKYGMRNGYLMAIAPARLSIIAGTTPGIDPIMNLRFLEEKKNGLLPRSAADLSSDTWWLYKDAPHRSELVDPGLRRPSASH